MGGETSNEIAKALLVSNKTMDIHRENIKKIGFANRTMRNQPADDRQYLSDNYYCFVSISKTKTLAHFFAFLSRNTWWMGSA
jgi:hypothetical protein